MQKINKKACCPHVNKADPRDCSSHNMDGLIIQTKGFRIPSLFKDTASDMIT